MPSKKPLISTNALLFLLASFIAAAIFIQYVLVGTDVVTYKDGFITCGVVRHPLDALAVHSSRVNFIRVGGKTYTHVRGLQPFYLRLQKLNSILFVTDAGEDGAEFHVVRIGDWNETTIYGKKIGFGGHIGDPDIPGSPYTEFVENQGSNEIVLATSYPSARLRIFLDLKAKKLIKLEYDELDGERVKEHHVYVDGKRVE